MQELSGEYSQQALIRCQVTGGRQAHVQRNTICSTQPKPQSKATNCTTEPQSCRADPQTAEPRFTKVLSLRYRSSQYDISTQNAEDTNHYYVIVQLSSRHEQQDLHKLSATVIP